MNISILILSLLFCLMQTMIFDFTASSNLDDWYIVDDGVMGGLSQGQFSVNEQGDGEFSGTVSLENNGGFSSVRHSLSTTDVSSYSKIKIRLKGDGKRYQFRAKTRARDRQSYISYFETSGNWEIIEINLAQLYPTFRGYRLDMPNFPGKQMEELAFLIANKKAESFKLEIDWIRLE